MLKRVNVSDVELGMFIHKLEGNWFKHPFWKSRFLLVEPDMLSDLHASDLKTVIIDTARGHDVRPSPQRIQRTLPAAIANGARRPPLIDSRPARRFEQAETITQADLRSTAPQVMAREFGLARKVAGESRKVVSRIFLESRLGKSVRVAQVTPVIEDIFASVQRNPHAFNGLMRCKRDNEYLYRHALAVSALMVSLARQMKLSPPEIREAGMAGLLHDVGTGHLSFDLSSVGGDFRKVPHAIMQQHVVLGHNFLEASGGIPPGVLAVCLNHHEALDGSGYPRGLVGEEIDLLSRMAAICDTYDVLVGDSAEGDGMNPSKAIDYLVERPSQFDPSIVRTFKEAMGVFPIGSVVRLRSDRLAMVVDQNPSDLARPVVRTFLSITEHRLIKAHDIALADCFGEDEISGAADPADYGIADFPRLREKLFAASATRR